MHTILDTGLLVYDGGSIKPRAGLEGGDIVADPNNVRLTIGTYIYPVVPINVFTSEPDGTIAVRQGKIVIAYANTWFTPNTVTLESVETPGPSQQAVITMQHGRDSRILTNIVTEEQQVVYVPNSPLSVTASNYATGAVGATSASPVAGQAYAVTTVSTTNNGGELAIVCIRKEFDLSSAPPVMAYDKEIFRGIAQQEMGTINTQLVKESDYNTNPYLLQQNISYALDELQLSQSFKDNYTRLTDVVYGPLRLEKGFRRTSIFAAITPEETNRPDITDGNIDLSNLSSGSVFVIPETDPGNTLFTFSIPRPIIDGVTATEMSDRAYFDLVWFDVDYFNETGNSRTFSFPAVMGERYQVMWDVTHKLEYRVGNVEITAFPDNTPAVRTSVAVDFVAYMTLVVLGPIEEVCAETETIDTRTVSNSITVTLTPLN